MHRGVGNITRRFAWLNSRRWPALLVVAMLVVAPTFGHANAATSADIQQLLAQQAQLRQQKLLQQQQAQQASQQAQQLGQQAQSLQQSISSVDSTITDTQGQIDQLTQSIQAKAQDISDTEAKLALEQEHQNEAIRTLYEVGSTDPLTIALGSSSIADVVQQDQFLTSIEQSVQRVIDDVTKTKADLEQQRQSLKDQQNKLSQLQNQQISQKVDLSNQEQTTEAQQAAATTQAQIAQSRVQQLQGQINAIEKKLSVLTATARWGTDIVSDAPAGWSYVQLDYPQHLGDSPFTIHDYGCLVTSLAMVATYYGHSITPPGIARHTEWFSDGNAYVSSIADGIGLVTLQRSMINWGVVDSELDSGHPVIVSIYLPQVGAINSDGSSHFIVISGHSNGHYLMQDPLGSGRGYSLGQVRSMMTFRSQ